MPDRPRLESERWLARVAAALAAVLFVAAVVVLLALAVADPSPLGAPMP